MKIIYVTVDISLIHQRDDEALHCNRCLVFPTKVLNCKSRLFKWKGLLHIEALILCIHNYFVILVDNIFKKNEDNLCDCRYITDITKVLYCNRCSVFPTEVFRP